MNRQQQGRQNTRDRQDREKETCITGSQEPAPAVIRIEIPASTVFVPSSDCQDRRTKH
jgi:hypothetical protein